MSGFTTLLQLVLSITLKQNTIGINTAKQCKYSNLHKQINTSRLLLQGWIQTAPFYYKKVTAPQFSTTYIQWHLQTYSTSTYKDTQYISIIFRHIEKNENFWNFPVWEFRSHSGCQIPTSRDCQCWDSMGSSREAPGVPRGSPHTPLSHLHKVPCTSPTMGPESNLIMAQ